MNRNLKYTAIGIGIFTALIILLAVSTGTKNPVENPIVQTPQIEVTPDIDTTRFDFSQKKELNSDYIGELRFESGLVIEDTVQGNDNEKYLDLSWDLKKDSSGASFLDYRNTLDDQNLIIYGHFVYADEDKMFGPLHQLKEEANYEENKTIFLEFEDEIREYVVARVFYYEMNSSTLRYFYPNYNTDVFDEYLMANEEYFDKYMVAVDKASFYEIDEELTIEDKWLTLQTCVRNRDDLRLIVIAKEVGRIQK